MRLISDGVDQACQIGQSLLSKGFTAPAIAISLSLSLCANCRLRQYLRATINTITAPKSPRMPPMMLLVITVEERLACAEPGVAVEEAAGVMETVFDMIVLVELAEALREMLEVLVAFHVQNGGPPHDDASDPLKGNVHLLTSTSAEEDIVAAARATGLEEPSGIVVRVAVDKSVVAIVPAAFAPGTANASNPLCKLKWEIGDEVLTWRCCNYIGSPSR